ncbi:MAG TPA: hypothetical protein VHC22_17165 [Pirellulales bacterium]|nr:hypothetical protein [Pirellulales bacterium]
MPRRFQFSLTWLAITALVLGAFFGGVATGRRCCEIENAHDMAEVRREWLHYRELNKQLIEGRQQSDP